MEQFLGLFVPEIGPAGHRDLDTGPGQLMQGRQQEGEGCSVAATEFVDAVDHKLDSASRPQRRSKPLEAEILVSDGVVDEI